MRLVPVGQGQGWVWGPRLSCGGVEATSKAEADRNPRPRGPCHSPGAVTTTDHRLGRGRSWPWGGAWVWKRHAGVWAGLCFSLSA